MHSLFDDDPDIPDPDEARPRPMLESQRSQIRDAFGALGLTTAREQFALVEELTGVRLNRVTDLTENAARTLMYALKGRAQNAGRSNTGDSWADREEDTWIDRL
ncbi:hypothetical protein [Microterricola viridarii]|uniref:Uncharacterized protein n=1 Tax=Microterricola viridarii TaxID=412690 RepID=A0A0X8E3S4_9MICO|nr:hypothetical protein [Microterricola viridarii]AMB59189.1 hypothetical protein AWU67_10295 [Microterricola viridarii]